MRLELKDLRLQEETTLLGLTHFFLFSFSVIPVPDQVEASYGGNPVFGRFLTPWIPVPRLREDKLHGNDTDCVSPTYFCVAKTTILPFGNSPLQCQNPCPS